MSQTSNDINEYINYLFKSYTPDLSPESLIYVKPFQFTLEEIEDLINSTYEEKTRCKLYNKSEILSQYKNDLSMEKLTQELVSNTICEIDFDKIFKSKNEFGCQLFFSDDDIYIMYKNKTIKKFDELTSMFDELTFMFDEIIPDKNCWDFIYSHTILNIIKSLYKKDLTVRYYCKNIPRPYWELFKIKCNKANQNNTINEKLENIINGNNYEKPVIEIDENPEIEEVSTIQEEYNYRMELMAYLDDNAMANFLSILENHDSNYKTLKVNDMQFFKSYMLFVGEKMNQPENRLVDYYLLFLLMKCYNLNYKIAKHSSLISLNNILKSTLNTFKNDLTVIEAMGLTFSEAFVTQYNICTCSL